MAIIFFVTLGLLVGSFIIYPLLLKTLSKLLVKPQEKASFKNDKSVSLVIAAYNEEAVISEKIKNSLNLNYPKDLLEIIVFSDSSSDKTDEIAESFSDQGIKLMRIEGRLGKTHCQNEVVKQCQSEIIVFSDANTMYSEDAISHMVQAFEDESVGCVVGKRVYNATDISENKEGLYERLENLIKVGESALGGTIGANGSIYAVKKEHYIPLDPKLMSDITEPLMIATTKNKKSILCSEAIGAEDVDNDFFTELKRKRRIVLRAMNSMWFIKKHLLLSPIILTKLIFHKVIRWFTLHLILIMIISGFLSQCCLLKGVASLAVLYLLISILTILYAKTTGKQVSQKILALCMYSFGVFYSSFMASIDFIKRKQKVVWETRS